MYRHVCKGICAILWYASIYCVRQQFIHKVCICTDMYVKGSVLSCGMLVYIV